MAEEKKDTAAEGLLNKIKNFLTQQYEPVFDMKDATLHFTTQQLFDKLQALFPSSYYSAADVAEWMHTAGYTFSDFGNMRFEWLMKSVD